MDLERPLSGFQEAEELLRRWGLVMREQLPVPESRGLTAFFPPMSSLGDELPFAEEYCYPSADPNRTRE